MPHLKFSVFLCVLVGCQPGFEVPDSPDEDIDVMGDREVADEASRDDAPAGTYDEPAPPAEPSDDDEPSETSEEAYDATGYCSWWACGEPSNLDADCADPSGSECWCEWEAENCESACGGSWCTGPRPTTAAPTFPMPAAGNCFVTPTYCPTGSYCSEDSDGAFSCRAVPATLSWKIANLTTYESYPDPGSDECLYYSGCRWSGWFSALPTRMSEAWVQSHNIVAFFSTDGWGYDHHELKTIRMREPGTDNTIDVVVYDTCADSDCSGCCSANAWQNGGRGTLLDIESYSRERFGFGGWDQVEWTCLDCD